MYKSALPSLSALCAEGKDGAGQQSGMGQKLSVLGR